jgi:hypothetical protein
MEFWLLANHQPVKDRGKKSEKVLCSILQNELSVQIHKRLTLTLIAHGEMQKRTAAN